MRFNPIRLTKTYDMQVPASSKQVFPLLCPVREYDWLPYWRCHMVYSNSGRAEAGCVFVTDFPERGNMTWVVMTYDPPKEIQYTVFKPESHVWNLEIILKPIDPALTHILWRHTFTAVCPEGNQFLSEYSDETHRLHLRFIEKALVHYLNTGEMIKD